VDQIVAKHDRLARRKANRQPAVGRLAARRETDARKRVVVVQLAHIQGWLGLLECEAERSRVAARACEEAAATASAAATAASAAATRRHRMLIMDNNYFIAGFKHA
jgi:hypothetical protein